MMRQTLTIARRDFAAFFGSPAAYVVLAIFVVLVSWLFTTSLFLDRAATMRGFLGSMPYVMLFVLPALAMRSFAEERKNGTSDLLATLPVRETEIVLGKYLALLGFWAVALALTAAVPVTLAALGDPDRGQIFAGYLAVFLAGAAILAVGEACSVLTENQIVAFLLGVAVTFALLMFGDPVVLGTVGPRLGVLLEQLSIRTHFDAMAKGVIDLRDLYYFAALAALALGFVLSVLESRKWR